MINPTLYSSRSEDWATPQNLFESLNKIFEFTLDPCASPENAKCEKYYTKEDDGLTKDWQGETVFCNPPYGRKVKNWVRKCYEESQKPNTTVVLLIAARTDTQYFHNYIDGKAEISFIRGRVKFEGGRDRATFPSMVVFYKPKQESLMRDFDLQGSGQQLTRLSPNTAGPVNFPKATTTALPTIKPDNPQFIHSDGTIFTRDPEIKQELRRTAEDLQLIRTKLNGILLEVDNVIATLKINGSFKQE